MDRTWLVPAATVLMGCLIAGIGGCRATARDQGSQGITATYKGRTLTSVLPASARVPAVIAAAEATVRARGYGVSKSWATEDSGALVCRPPRTGDYPELHLEAHTVAGGTAVELTVQPLGDQEMSRSVLDGVLQRLGL